MASETTWKAGDTVMLKSGGPVMTVQGEAGGASGQLHCLWFRNEKRRGDNFHPDTLKAATPGRTDSGGSFGTTEPAG